MADHDKQSYEVPPPGTLPLGTNMAEFDLTITFNGLVAVRHTCGELMVLPAGHAAMGEAIRLTLAHECHGGYRG